MSMKKKSAQSADMQVVTVLETVSSAERIVVAQKTYVLIAKSRKLLMTTLIVATQDCHHFSCDV